MIAPPPWPRITGMAYLQPRNAEPVLTFIMVHHSSMLISSTGLRMLMPALFTSTSSLPHSPTAASTAACQSASLVTSDLKNQACPPAALISSAVACPFSASRSRMTTFAPFLHSRRAISLPRPPPAPVIIAIVPTPNVE